MSIVISRYTCACKPGYAVSSLDGITCEDIDECALGTDDCGQTCVNIGGGFVCSCESGYNLGSDGMYCFTAVLIFLPRY